METHWLPDEIWEKIFFSYELSPSDILNCYKLNPNWARIILNKQNLVTVLLPEVIPCISQYLGLRELLSCRQVCYHWRAVVDSCVVPVPRFSISNPCIPQLITSIDLSNSRIKSRFKRSIRFRQLSIYGKKMYRDKNFEMFLDRFGREIFHLYIHTYEFLSKFFSVFQHFPNLKTLAIVMEKVHHLYYGNADYWENIEEREIAKFGSVAASDLKLLDSLEALKFVYNGSHPFSWLNELSRRAGSRLHTLVVELVAPSYIFVENPTRIKLPNPLTKLLPIENVKLQGVFLTWQNLHLTKITLTIANNNVNPNDNNVNALLWYLQMFLNVLQNCFRTLEEFSFFCLRLPCFYNEMKTRSRSCMCNNIFNVGGDFENIYDICETSSISCNSLKRLDISHYFLHPKIFPKIMQICCKTKELKINDFYKIVPKGGLDVEESVFQLWPECCESLEKIFVKAYYSCENKTFCKDEGEK